MNPVKSKDDEALEIPLWTVALQQRCGDLARAWTKLELRLVPVLLLPDKITTAMREDLMDSDPPFRSPARTPHGTELRALLVTLDGLQRSINDIRTVLQI